MGRDRVLRLTTGVHESTYGIKEKGRERCGGRGNRKERERAREAAMKREDLDRVMRSSAFRHLNSLSLSARVEGHNGCVRTARKGRERHRRERGAERPNVESRRRQARSRRPLRARYTMLIAGETSGVLKAMHRGWREEVGRRQDDESSNTR